MKPEASRGPAIAAIAAGAACFAYAANAALGLAVANKAIDTSGIRWVHHALYITTCALTGAAIASGVGVSVANRQRPRGRRGVRARQHAHRLPATAAGWMLVPAIAPLAAIPTVSARTRTHPLIALIAAPFYTAAGLSAARAMSKARR